MELLAQMGKKRAKRRCINVANSNKKLKNGNQKREKKSLLEL